MQVPGGHTALMFYVVHCLDGPNRTARAELYQAHRDYLDQQPLTIFAAGPLLDDSGERALGSVFILECETRAEVDDFLAHEPFNCAGLFARIDVHRWLRRR